MFERETDLQQLERTTMSDPRSSFDPFPFDLKSFETRYQAVLDAFTREEPMRGNAAELFGQFLRGDIPAVIRSLATTRRAADRLEIALIAERVERTRLLEERDMFQQEVPADRRRALADQLEQQRARRFRTAIDNESGDTNDN